MDIQPQTAKPISDDQELAKVLAGVTHDTDSDFKFEETPVVTPIPTPTPIAEPVTETPGSPSPLFGYTPPAANNAPKNDLEGIKKDALNELRPLVDKLDLSPEEKFDIYLLLLRSTDDVALIAPAHATAQKISDESKRAQALLDIIKEIDFLSNPVQPAI
jgi:hypothetical protein